MLKGKIGTISSNVFLKYIFFFGYCIIYLFLRAREAFGISWSLSFTVLFPALTCVVLAPLVVHLTIRRGGRRKLTRAAFWAGYSWMGFLLLFAFVSTSVDLVSLILSTTTAVAGPFPDLAFTNPHDMFLISIVLSTLLSVYALLEAGIPRSKRIILETDKLPGGVDTVRIAQVSDIHLGPVVGRKRAGRIARKIADMRPDLILSTGDFIDARADYLSGLEDIFCSLSPPMGKYAVLGNHEVSAGLDGCLNFMERAGFRVLRDESVIAGDAVCLSGVDDESVYEEEGRGRPAGLPEGKKPDLFTICMKHRPPRGDEYDSGDFDLQLSGHTHGGQMFPFSFVSMGYYQKLRGMYELDSGRLLYVNPGAGTWGPPMRFLTPPEVTVIDLVRPKERASS